MTVDRKTPKNRGKKIAPSPAEVKAKADRAAGIEQPVVDENAARDFAPAIDDKAQIASDLEEARRLFEEAQARAVAAGIASPAVHIEKTNSSTVWIGCKLPSGLLLQLHEQAEIDRPVMGGGIKPTKVFLRSGEVVRLKGASVPFGKLPNFPIEGGYSLTPMARSFWEKWLEQNKQSDIVMQGLVFCQSDRNEAEAEARDKESLRSGLEPLSGPEDPRVEKLKTPNLEDIAIDSDRNAFKQVA